jgi:uncharacterized peroxidase-related enzyme
MSRLKPISPASAIEKTKQMYNSVALEIGKVPDMLQIMGNSSDVLKAYLDFANTIRRMKLDDGLQELIALVVAEANGCSYCLSAHMYFARRLKIDSDTCLAARSAEAPDTRVDSVLKFARALVIHHGHVTNEELNSVREAGFNESQITEIIAVVALNIFSNYFNAVALPEIDFPNIETRSFKTADSLFVNEGRIYRTFHNDDNANRKN